MSDRAILLPGVVLPPDLAYADLIESLGDGVTARAKELEVYSTADPGAEFAFDAEIDGVSREAERAGFERFHLVGYSAGGAVAAAFAAAHPDRVLSLALLESSWLGNEGRSERERRAWAEVVSISELPAEEMLARFIRAQLAPGVEPPPPPPGPDPSWMASRPAGIRAVIDAFAGHELDPAALRAFQPPVYYALGGLSNPDYYGEMATRAADLFGDFTLEVYEGRHHFDPPHRAEPQRVAERLRSLWERAEAGDGG